MEARGEEMRRGPRDGTGMGWGEVVGDIGGISTGVGTMRGCGD